MRMEMCAGKVEGGRRVKPAFEAMRAVPLRLVGAGEVLVALLRLRAVDGAAVDPAHLLAVFRVSAVDEVLLHPGDRLQPLEVLGVRLELRGVERHLEWRPPRGRLA